MDKMDEKGRDAFDEFRDFCDSIRKKHKWSKKVLARNLGIDASYYSRLYHGRVENMPEKILMKVRALGSASIGSSPEGIMVQEHLPLSPNEGMHEIAMLNAVLDKEIERNSRLQDRVAVLEEGLKQSKADSEKKIFDLEQRTAYAIRVEVEQLKSRLSRPAANDR